MRVGWLIAGSLAAGCGRSNRCEADPWGFGSVEVGVGTRDFIAVPWGAEVSPDSAVGAEEPYYNVAIRTWGLRPPLTVELGAWVDGQRYAQDRHEGVDLRCKRWAGEAGALRMRLDPADLPPMKMPEPIEPSPDDDGRLPRPGEDPAPVPPREDTGWRRDTGYIWVDTGGWPQGWVADVQVTASVRDADGRSISGESWWLIVR